MTADPGRGESSFLGDVLRSEAVGGAIALVAATAAVVWANLDDGSYAAFQHLMLGPLDLEHWASDGALAIFFFVAGLELKREFLVGSLRRPADAAVPVVASVCGVAVPSVIYLIANHGTANLGGWAIPAATDIAFALAVLAVVGSRLPAQLRAFLLTLAVVDDLIVIAIIAVFYTDSISWLWLLAAVAAASAYVVLQQLRVRASLVYVPLALLTWWAVHESGIHATIAGVTLGLLTRVLPDQGEQRSPAERLEHRLVPVSAGAAVPFFALLSAGVVLTGGVALLRHPIVLGVALGLVLGKPIGVLGGSWLVTRFTRAELDENLSWHDLVAVAVLAGIGFTVSLLVSDLSFSDVRQQQAKTAVLLGSVTAAVAAALLLRWRHRQHAST